MQRLTRREQGGRTLRGILAGTLVTGTLLVGAGAFVGVAPAGAAPAINTSTTCPSPSKLTPAE